MSILLTEDGPNRWLGFHYGKYRWRCNVHNMEFTSRIYNVLYSGRGCEKCKKSKQLAKAQEKVLKDGRYYLISTDWYGYNKHYLWFCPTCDIICVSLWHDIINKKQSLACCYTKQKYNRNYAGTTHDAIAKYLVYKGDYNAKTQ